ncbi:MAG: PKD domain-containing protein [Solirubrobacteraceae bacterium]
MTHLRPVLAGVVAALALTLPAAAGADSIVYLAGGNVWIANADGSGARQFTEHQYGWSSPSEADDGTIVAAGGLSHVNADGTDSSGSSELYRFAGDGNQLGDPIPTWGSYSTPSCPTYGPTSVRVSPDASKIAYGILDCGDFSYTTLWTPATATGLSFPNQSVGQQDFYEPAWLGSDRFTVSHAGPTVTDTQAQWYVHGVGEGDNVGTGWNEPAASGDTARAVISRDGTRLAVFQEDSAGWSDGHPRSVHVWTYTSPGSGLPTGDWTQECDVALDASRISDPFHLSPSLSPNGSKLLWADNAGVEVASIAGGCAGIAPHLLIAGGSQPLYAEGSERPGAANPRQPGAPAPAPAPAPGATTAPSTTTTPATGSSPVAKLTRRLVAAFSVRTRHARRRHRVAFDATRSSDNAGRIVAWTWSFDDRRKGRGRKVSHAFAKAGMYRVTLTVRDGSGVTARVTHKVKVGR